MTRQIPSTVYKRLGTFYYICNFSNSNRPLCSDRSHDYTTTHPTEIFFTSQDQGDLVKERFTPVSTSHFSKTSLTYVPLTGSYERVPRRTLVTGLLLETGGPPDGDGRVLRDRLRGRDGQNLSGHDFESPLLRNLHKYHRFFSHTLVTRLLTRTGLFTQ